MSERRTLSLLIALLCIIAFLVTRLDAITPPQRDPLPPGPVTPLWATISYSEPGCSGDPTEFELISTFCIEDSVNSSQIYYVTCTSEYMVTGNCTGTCRSNPLGLCAGTSSLYFSPFHTRLLVNVTVSDESKHPLMDCNGAIKQQCLEQVPQYKNAVIQASYAGQFVIYLFIQSPSSTDNRFYQGLYHALP